MKKLLLLLVALASLASAQAPPDGYIPIWIEKTGQLADGDVLQAVNALALENPQNIVILVHGYATPREASAAQYKELSTRIRAAFAKQGKQVSVLGVQWNSDVGSVVFDYGDTVTVARGVGRYGMRQILLALQQKFPKAHLAVWGHSMGTEVTMAALKPKLTFDEEASKLPIFESGKSVNLDMFALCGSDLDYDVLYKGGAYALDGGKVKFVWMTVAYNFGKREDEVLKARETARGLAAGSVIPRMTPQEYDAGMSAKKVVFDNQNIPENHSFLEYYSPDRIGQLVGAMLWVGDNKNPKPQELVMIDEVANQPDLPQLIAPYLDHPHMSPRIYAMWRLEKLLCGSSQHMADDYLRNIAKKLVHTPAVIKGMRPESPCQTVKQGWFPTKQQMQRAGAPEGG